MISYRLRELFTTYACSVCAVPRGLYRLTDTWPAERMGAHRHPRFRRCEHFDCPCAEGPRFTVRGGGPTEGGR